MIGRTVPGLGILMKVSVAVCVGDVTILFPFSVHGPVSGNAEVVEVSPAGMAGAILFRCHSHQVTSSLCLTGTQIFSPLSVKYDLSEHGFPFKHSKIVVSVRLKENIAFGSGVSMRMTVK